MKFNSYKYNFYLSNRTTKLKSANYEKFMTYS